MQIFQQRHVSDRNVNGRKSYVVRNGSLCEEDWSNVKVGDVIRMMSNQFVAVSHLVHLRKWLKNNILKCNRVSETRNNSDPEIIS